MQLMAILVLTFTILNILTGEVSLILENEEKKAKLLSI